MALQLDPYSYFGRVVRMEFGGSMLLTETVYEAGLSLPSHSHGSSHLAILLEGAYLERTSSGLLFCLPGDAVHYGIDEQHLNQFGRRSGRCLNLEFEPGRAPSACRENRSYVPSEIRMLVDSRGKTGRAAAPDWIDGARRRLDSDPGLTLSHLADEFGVHPSYLARRFRRAFGLSVGDYASLSRIRRAAGQLLTSAVPIAEVALDCGFFDQSHMTNAFSRVTGFTPAGLRRAIGG